MIRRLADLAAGRVPLAEAFWTYAVFWGVLINGAATLASLGLVAAKAANWAALTAHLAPIPWNLLVVIAVWRSAAHPGVPRPLAAAARFVTFVWAILLSAL